jgi:hypothetical protein
MNKEEQAEMFARGAHAGQKHGEKPYWTHLKKTTQVLSKLGCDDPYMKAAAWLHDTIEDTPVTYQDIKYVFGKYVAELVWAMTDEMGRNRKERKVKTKKKTFATKETTLLKLADLGANVENAVDTKSKILSMYTWDIIINKVKEFLGPQGIDLFRDYLAKYDRVDPTFLDGRIPHPVHFREGTAVRNFLRSLEECKDWTDHDYDNNWVILIEEAIK